MPEIFNVISLEGWILQVVAMVVTALLIPGLRVTSIFGPFLAVLALGFINAHLWSTALFFRIPDSFTIHALSLVVVNGLIFWVLVKLLPGIEVKGILPALAAPMVFAVCSLLVFNFGKEIDWGNVLQQIAALFEELRSYFLAIEPPVEATPVP